MESPNLPYKERLRRNKGLIQNYKIIIGLEEVHLTKDLCCFRLFHKGKFYKNNTKTFNKLNTDIQDLVLLD